MVATKIYFGEVADEIIRNDQKRKGYKPLNLFMEKQKKCILRRTARSPLASRREKYKVRLQAPKFIYGDH